MLQRKLVVVTAAALLAGGMNGSLAADPAADKKAREQAAQKAAQDKAAQDKAMKAPPDSVDKAGIGSATGGAGAGKVKFNEFTIKKTTDSASPKMEGLKVDPSDPSKKAGQ